MNIVKAIITTPFYVGLIIFMILAFSAACFLGELDEFCEMMEW